MPARELRGMPPRAVRVHPREKEAGRAQPETYGEPEHSRDDEVPNEQDVERVTARERSPTWPQALPLCLPQLAEAQAPQKEPLQLPQDDLSLLPWRAPIAAERSCPRTPAHKACRRSKEGSFAGEQGPRAPIVTLRQPPRPARARETRR